MEKRRTLTYITALMIALLALASIAVYGAPNGDPKEVTISGWLYAEEAELNDAIVVVELEHSTCLWSELKANGHFEFKVPVGAQARLVFLKPGFLVKEVVVDTKNAMNCDRARKLNKNVKFDVVLESQEEHSHEVYLGPVGYITFVNGTGLMRVQHDERMTALPDNALEIQEQ